MKNTSSITVENGPKFRSKIPNFGLDLCKTIIFIIVILCSCKITHGADPVFTNATLNDNYGNEADSNSSIKWASIPDGIPYKAANNYNDGGLGPLFNFARAFLGIVQPNPFPEELVKSVVDNSFDFSKDYMKIIYYVMGFAVCFAIGILFIIVMPILGCCFCLCRCCGCCGGKMIQKHSDNLFCKRTVFSVILLVLTIFMAVGMICTYVTSDHMSTAINEIQTTGVDNIDDITSFMNNTLEEMEFVATKGFDFAADVIIRDLDNIGYLVGVPVRDALGASGVDSAINAIKGLETSIKLVAPAMLAVNTSVTNLKNNGVELTSQLKNISDSILAIQTNNPVDCATACQSIPANDLVMEVDFNSLPDISQEVQQMQDVESQNLSAKADQGKKEFDDIPWRVVNETANIVTDLKSQLTSFKSTINTQLNQVTSLPNKVLQPVQDAKKEIDTYGTMIGEYNQYRWYGGVGLAGTIAIIVILQFLGLIFGICGSTARTNPIQRGSLSNCGGILLMAAVGFIFIFSWILMLLTSLSFLIGGNLEKAVCEPLTDPEYKIFKLIDEPGGFLDKDGYFLGSTLFQNNSIPLTISGTLESCKNHEAAYSALKLNNLFDLDTLADYSKDINIDSELAKINDSVSLGDVKILSSDAENQLRDFSNAVQIDFNGFVTELSKNTTKVNLTAFAEVIRAAKNGSSPSVEAELEAEAVKLEAMDTGIVKDVSDSQAQLLADVNTLNQSVAQIPDLVNQTIDTVKTAEANLGTQGGIIIPTEVSKYADRVLGIANSFTNYTLNSIKTDIGDCYPLYNLWYSLINLILCKYTIDTFNGFWFALGWAIFFMVPSIIFNVKLAKHFRRMKYADDNFEFDPNVDIPLSKNKVAPAL